MQVAIYISKLVSRDWLTFVQTQSKYEEGAKLIKPDDSYVIDTVRGSSSCIILY